MQFRNFANKKSIMRPLKQKGPRTMTMKQLLTILLLALVSTVQGQTLRRVFVEMPDSIVPLLSSVNRQDGMDYVDNDMPIDVTNKLGNITTISGEKGHYIDINTATQAWTRLMLLPTTKGDTLICLTKTVCIDKARDSQMLFYNTNWERLKNDDYVICPATEDFMLWNDSIGEDERKEVMKKIDITLMEIITSYEPNDSPEAVPTIIFKLHSPSYMNEDDRKLLEPWVKKAITMRWNGVKFE